MTEPADAPYRFAVNVTPKPGILDPQGRAVEQQPGAPRASRASATSASAGAWS